MSKNVELVYDAFKGINVQSPENKIPKEFSPSTQGFWVRNNELRSAPVFESVIPFPSATSPVGAIGGFYDAAGGLHVFAIVETPLTGSLLYQLGSGGTWSIIPFGGAPITAFAIASGGTGYAVGDTGIINNPAGNNPNMQATYTVLTETGGVVNSIQITYGGTGYVVAGSVTTATGGSQPGSGSGLTLNITSVGNSPIALGGVPYAWRVFAGILYFTNGAAAVGYWDGIASSWYQLNTQVTEGSLGSISTTSLDSGGSGYAVGDTGTFVGGNNNATYVVNSIGGGGAVATYSLTNLGSGYTANGSLPVATMDGGSQPGSGSGFTIFITGVTSTPVIGSVGAAFLAESNNSLLLLNTTEQTGPTAIQTYSQRERWSANGLPNVWDPNVNISAGSNDFLDVPDAITGALTMGSSVVYIFRTNGITEQTVNGSGSLPYTWNHLWGEQHGIGNVYPYTIDSYGSVGFFVDFENVYQVSVYSFEPIGGTARDAIMADLANTNAGQPIGGVCDQLVNGVVYLTYMLCIPFGSGPNIGTKIWKYSLEDKTWTPDFVSGFIATSRPFRVWTPS